jgi:hypothetical protein
MSAMPLPRRVLAVALLAAIATLGCGGGLPQQPSKLAADVAALDAVVPLLEELRVTDFEASPYCRNLAYRRGAFGHLAQDGCQRAGTVEFDEVALADHGRLAEAIEASGVTTGRLREATYTPDGDLETAWFMLNDASIDENGDYLYDPTGAEPKDDVPGEQTFTRINDAWWFVWSRDD